MVKDPPGRKPSDPGKALLWETKWARLCKWAQRVELGEYEPQTREERAAVIDMYFDYLDEWLALYMDHDDELGLKTLDLDNSYSKRRKACS